MRCCSGNLRGEICVHLACMRPRNGVAGPREREMYANLAISEPHACDSLLQKPNVFFSRAQVQNDDVYRATIGVSSWHITRASPYDGGSRARRIEKCPWGGRSPTSSCRRCLSTPPRPQVHAPSTRVRTMSRSVLGLVVGLGGYLKCEGGSASTKTLNAQSTLLARPLRDTRKMQPSRGGTSPRIGASGYVSPINYF